MSLKQITTHISDAAALLPSWLQSAINLNALLKIFSNRWQLLENMFWQLYTLRDINNAVGNQLDVIGRILNLSRTPGQSDDNYRIGLRAQVSYLSHSGELEILIQTYLSLFQIPAGNVLSIEAIETEPATIKLTVNLTADPSIDAQVSAVMKNVRAAGINLILQKAINRPFRYKHISDTNHPELGYQSISSPGTGGNYSNMISQYT